ncbi:hypothetical protein GA0074692_0032 [Micromonospora pallida]|uniref:Transposase IS30-like HTH domain-containing protein n=1 Tax=Micromonospora pallida TaxID=145854 RepID=A0A1C6RHB4_9ACTN|nr:helix-turn-helix domain-containing protein [Micromonospora pallida]SCL16448.1 hypothetical protein GA0074692_0032 [Micromonospora pallida]
MTATPDCPARRHGTASARRHQRCCCPEAIAAAKAANHRGYLSRGYIRGSVSNQRAPRHGFDEVVVDRAVDGPRPAQMTLPEIHAAIDRLTARGESAREIAKRLGVTTRTVTRQRARRRASIRTG